MLQAQELRDMTNKMIDQIERRKKAGGKAGSKEAVPELEAKQRKLTKIKYRIVGLAQKCDDLLKELKEKIIYNILNKY